MSRSCQKFVTTLTIALAIVGLGAASASAQNPFKIDGIITDANNSGVAPQALKKDDPGSVAELGPLNGNPYQIVAISSSPTPVLGYTSQPSKVDLSAIYSQTAKAADGDLWYYFAWSRETNLGSGFISIEFQQNGLSAACDYAGVDLIKPKTLSQADIALINNCNPWKNRKAGDFLLLWDQTGNSNLTIYKRVFAGVAPNLTLGPLTVLGSASAKYSSDFRRGEAAVNLTDDVFPNDGACLTFANIIPNTLTGNSDTSDYKDTVLAAFPPITNCGIVTVTKVTQPGGLSASFPYTLSAPGGIFDGTIDSDCADSNSTAQCHAILTQDGDSDTITDLLAKNSYTLTEDPVPHFEKVSIACSLNGSDYNVYPGGSTFPVEAGATTACTITNRQLQGSLKVVKIVHNNHGGTKVSSDFRISLGDIQATVVDGSEAGVTRTFDEGYAFSVGEFPVAGYRLVSMEGACSGTIVANTTLVCTITNEDIPAHLKLVKTVTNDNGGTAQATAFTLSAAGPTPISGAGGAESDVSAGTYNLSETQVEGYTAGAWSCTGDGVQNGSSITLALAQSATCTINNNDNPPHLIVIKHVINDNGGSAVAGDFTMTVTNSANPAPFPGQESPGTNVSVNAGAYSVTESALAGYEQTGAIGCDGTIALGETKTCTITNNDIPAHLIVIKHVEHPFGDTETASDFIMTINQVTTVEGNSFPGSETGTTRTLTSVGQYNVTELIVPGYTQVSTSADCSGTIALGETKTCIIVNRDSKAAPSGTTGQNAVLHDSFTIVSGIRPGGGTSSVTFSLFLDAACTIPAKDDGTAVETRDFVANSAGTGGSSQTVTGVGPLPSGIYFWKAVWSGDNFNESFTTSCGKADSEKATILFEGQ